ncbi:MAG: NifB/NifX family molybdenum-iron cluster-binding protein [Thermodesulfobacteriota bacterium]
MNSVVALPSEVPGGLEAGLGAHFGHCEIYTLVTVEDGRITKVTTLPGVPHQQGGCLAPVQYLAQNGVKILISGGMGMRPLLGFNQMGIDVYYGAGVATVKEALAALLEGRLPQFSQEYTCGGAR